MISQFFRDIVDKKEPLVIGAISGMIIIMMATANLAPALLGNPLNPPMMVNHTLGLQDSSWVGWAAHLLVGLVIFPLAYMLLAYRNFPGPALVKGLLFALVVGIVAGVAAPLTGNQMFMGNADGAVSLFKLHAAYFCLIALMVGKPVNAEEAIKGHFAGS